MNAGCCSTCLWSMSDFGLDDLCCRDETVQQTSRVLGKKKISFQ